MNTTACGRYVLAIATLLCFAFANSSSQAAETKVVFDVPDTIECRDVTPKDFVAAHPSLKVIEAKFRVSARIVDGSETDLVDFLYTLVSPGLRLKIQDYLPNTTLESTTADDRIEVTATSEDSDTTTGDAHVAYKPGLFMSPRVLARLRAGFSRTKCHFRGGCVAPHLGEAASHVRRTVLLGKTGSFPC
jgi:hypothetical protein